MMKKGLSVLSVIALALICTLAATETTQAEEVYNPGVWIEEKLYVPYDTAESIAEEEYYDSLELLALCVEAEAGNQSLYGKRLVVDVILNRVDSPYWPDTIEGVITQRGQFTTWSNGAIMRVEPSDETFEAVEMELDGRLAYNIVYFTAGHYGQCGHPWGQVGNHYFCTR